MGKWDYWHEYKRRRVAQGKCINCGRPNDRGTVFCEFCLKKIAAMHKIRRQKYREEGRCIRCGKLIEGDPEGQKRECLRCSVMNDKYRKNGGWL